MTRHRALNIMLACLIALLLASACLLDGPPEIEAAQAVAADLQDAIKSVAINERLTRATGQTEQQNTVVVAVAP